MRNNIKITLIFVQTGKEWTDGEIALLAKAVARFPAGVSSRWEKIAEFTERSVTEVRKEFIEKLNTNEKSIISFNKKIYLYYR